MLFRSFIILFVYLCAIAALSIPQDHNISAGRSVERNSISADDLSTLDLAKLQNNSISSEIDPINDSTILVDPITCFNPRPFFAPIGRASDCNTAVNAIWNQGRPHQRILWTSREWWSFGTCRVELRKLKPEGSEYFTRARIAVSATAIIGTCVTESRGYLGGYVAIGDTGTFQVEIFGRLTGASAISSANS